MAFLISVKVISPKKSILSRPSFSISVILNWVVTSSPDFASGTWSLIASRHITTPAACFEQFLGIPSTRIAISSTFLTVSSFSYRSISSRTISCGSCLSPDQPSTSFILSLGAFGISLVILFISAKGTL